MPMKKKIRTKTFVTLKCFNFLFYYTSIVAFLNVLPPLIFFFNYLSWISYAQSASSEIPLRSSASWRDSQSCPASSSMEKETFTLYLIVPLRTSASRRESQSCPARSSMEKTAYTLYLILPFGHCTSAIYRVTSCSSAFGSTSWSSDECQTGENSSSVPVECQSPDLEIW